MYRHVLGLEDNKVKYKISGCILNFINLNYVSKNKETYSMYSKKRKFYKIHPRNDSEKLQLSHFKIYKKINITFRWSRLIFICFQIV